MDAQETLAQIDFMMNVIDLEMRKWWEALDMMSFIGQDVPLMLWTNDDPPTKLPMSQLPNLLEYNIHEVRVMHLKDGEWGEVGTAKLDHKTGEIVAAFDGSRHGPLAHFEMDKDGNVKQNFRINYPPFEGFNKPLTIREVLDEAIAKEEQRRQNRHSWIYPDDIEHHSFFKKED